MGQEYATAVEGLTAFFVWRLDKNSNLLKYWLMLLAVRGMPSVLVSNGVLGLNV